MSKVIYGFTMENKSIINKKAKEKNDGVYTFRGVSYRIRDGNVTHVAVDGQLLEVCGYFDVVVGKCGSYTSDQVKALKEIQS